MHSIRELCITTPLFLGFTLLFCLSFFHIYIPIVETVSTQAGLVSVSHERSCFQYDGTLDCGASQFSTVTDVQLSIPIGSDDPFTYEFITIVPDQNFVASEDPNSLNSNGLPSLNPNAQCKMRTPATSNNPHGQCVRTKRVKITVSSSKLQQVYTGTLRSELKIPWAYTGHESSAVNKADVMNVQQSQNASASQVQTDTVDDYTKPVNVLQQNAWPGHQFYWRNTLSENVLTEPYFLTPPFATGVNTDFDSTLGPFENNRQSCTGIFGDLDMENTATMQRMGWCSPCLLWSLNFQNPFLLSSCYTEGNGDDDESDVFPLTNDRSLYNCPWDEGRDYYCKDGICNCDAESGCPADNRTYCGSACSDYFSQDFPDNMIGRMWAGSYSILAPIYKCLTNGNGWQSGDTGIDHYCIMNNPNYTVEDIYANCITDTPPLYGFCEHPVEHYGNKFANMKDFTNGPSVLMPINPTLVGLSPYRMGWYPNTGYHFPAQIPGRRPAEGFDGSPCSIDDDDCASYWPLSQFTQVDNQHTAEHWVAMAECRPSGCFPVEASNNVYGNDGAIPASARCTDPSVIKNPRRCNEPYPAFKNITKLWTDPDLQNYQPLGIEVDRPSGFFNINQTENGQSICITGPRDRFGLISTNQPTGNTFVAPTYHTSGQITGMMLPQCWAWEYEGTPTASYALKFTVEYPEDDSSDTEEIILGNTESLAGFGYQLQAQNTTKDGSILFRLNNLLKTGRIGPDMPGLWVLCNTSKPVDHIGDIPPDTPPNTFDMSKGLKDEFGLPLSPFPELYKSGKTLVYEDSNELLDNNQLPAMLPLQGTFRDLFPGIPAYSMAYYVGQEDMHTYGTGCNQIGSTPQIYNDAGYVDHICQSEIYECIPCMWRGHRWLVQQRWYDSDVLADIPLYPEGVAHDIPIMNKTSNNNGTYERYLRDTQLKEHCPGVISGMFQDILVRGAAPGKKTCAQAKADNRRYRHLPLNYWPDVERSNGQCFEPVFFHISPNTVIRDDITSPTGAQGQVSVLTEISAANSFLLKVDETLGFGSFIPEFSPTKTCSCMQSSSDGKIFFEIKNTSPDDANPASYLVVGQCDTGVVVTTMAQIDNLYPGQTAQGALSVSHDGEIRNLNSINSITSIIPFGCNLLLYPTSLPGLILDEMNITCSLVPNIAVENSGLNYPPLSLCAQDGICPQDFTKMLDDQNKQDAWFLFWVVLTALIVIVIIVLYGVYKIYLNQDIYISRLDLEVEDVKNERAESLDYKKLKGQSEDEPEDEEEEEEEEDGEEGDGEDNVEDNESNVERQEEQDEEEQEMEEEEEGEGEGEGETVAIPEDPQDEE